MALGDDLDRLTLLQRRETILKRRAKEAAAKREAWEREVYDRMLDEGWEADKSTLNRNGVKFRPHSKDFAVIQDAKLLKAWLLTDGDEGLVEDRFKQGELNHLIREKLDNGEELPPGLGYHTKTSIGKSGLMSATDDHDDTQEDTDGEGQ